MSSSRLKPFKCKLSNEQKDILWNVAQKVGIRTYTHIGSHKGINSARRGMSCGRRGEHNIPWWFIEEESSRMALALLHAHGYSSVVTSNSRKRFLSILDTDVNTVWIQTTDESLGLATCRAYLDLAVPSVGDSVFLDDRGRLCLVTGGHSNDDGQFVLETSAISDGHVCSSLTRSLSFASVEDEVALCKLRDYSLVPKKSDHLIEDWKAYEDDYNRRLAEQTGRWVASAERMSSGDLTIFIPAIIGSDNNIHFMGGKCGRQSRLEALEIAKMWADEVRGNPARLDDFKAGTGLYVIST